MLTTRLSFLYNKDDLCPFMSNARETPVPSIINGVRLLYRPVIKFLGLTFDRQLTYNEHMDDLAARCKSSLKETRCVSHITWETDRDILLRLYTALVIFKMDYGCAVYLSLIHI